MTARTYWRLFALTLAIAAYWWGLVAYIVVRAGEEGSIWPFLAVPPILVAQGWLWRKLRHDARSNEAFGLMKRRQWENRLRYWAPVASLAYLWLSARRTAR